MRDLRQPWQRCSVRLIEALSIDSLRVLAVILGLSLHDLVERWS